MYEEEKGPAQLISEPRRLLAVNLNYLGDAVFTTPALAALRRRFPHAHIDVLAGERAAAVLEGSPDIDRLLRRPARSGLARSVFLYKVLRAGRYDAVVLFQSVFSSAALARLAGVPVRVGFAQDGARPLLTHPVAPRAAGEHVIPAYARLAGALGAAEAELRLKVTVPAADDEFAWQFRRDHELGHPIAGLVIGATRPQKRWPEEHWAALAAKLQAAGVAAVLLGGPEEADAAARIRALAAGTPLVSAVGRTDTKQLAALLARCQVVVSGDTGPLHVATALDVPVVALYGSTDPAATGPWGVTADRPARGTVLYEALPCAPCRKSPTCGGEFPCLRLLTPERVGEVVFSILGGSKRRLSLAMAAAAAAAPQGTPR